MKMKPTRCWAIVINDFPLLSFISATKPLISKMHADCRVARVELREVPPKRKPKGAKS